MRIIGLDVGSSSVVACALSEVPRSLRGFFNTNKQQILQLNATRDGIDTLLGLQPDIVVMEPTGVHYSEFWNIVLVKCGIEVRWVGHVQIRNYRKSERLPDKNDRADALALACYCLRHLHEPEFFLRFTPYPADRLRRLCLQLRHLNRVQNPIICCARQYLAHEFPEAAQLKSERQVNGDVPPLWGWLAQERESAYYDRLWSRSVAQQFGMSISDFTRHSAKRICDLERQQDAIEQEMVAIALRPDFNTYSKVFDEFGFGLRVRSLLLSHIYPFADFLGPDLQPIIDMVPSVEGKMQKRERSLRAFKLRLGLGLVEDASGKSQNWVPGGSSLCRQALWQWCLTRIEPKGSRRLPSPIGQSLGQYIDGLKAGGTPAKVAQMRCCSKAVTLLFRELVKVVQ